jgi:hypothetical protein
MPQPTYMLCCLASSEDKATGLISHFNVIESVEINIPPLEPSGIALAQAFSIQIVAVWQRSAPIDATAEFEMEIVATRPGETKPASLFSGRFKFEKERYRMVANLTMVPHPNSKSGIFRFVSRVRQVGTTKWSSQEYCVHSVVKSSIPPEPSSTNGKKRKPRKKGR